MSTGAKLNTTNIVGLALNLGVVVAFNTKFGKDIVKSNMIRNIITLGGTGAAIFFIWKIIKDVEKARKAGQYDPNLVPGAGYTQIPGQTTLIPGTGTQIPTDPGAGGTTPITTPIVDLTTVAKNIRDYNIQWWDLWGAYSQDEKTIKELMRVPVEYAAQLAQVYYTLYGESLRELLIDHLDEQEQQQIAPWLNSM